MKGFNFKPDNLTKKAEMYNNKEHFDIRFIEFSNIIPNTYNEEVYELSGIESLAENIKEYGLKQNLEVNEFVDENGEKKYRLIGGHRRLKAIELLRNESEEFAKKFESLPCKVEKNLSEIEEKIKLLKSNSDTRELTSKEKVKQTEELTKLLKSLSEETGENINIKKAIQEATGQDRKSVERQMNINERLIPELKAYFEADKITTKEAYSFAVLDEQLQLAILNMLQEKDKITKEELEVIRSENKKLIEQAEEKAKELEVKEKELAQKEIEIKNLEKEKSELSQDKLDLEQELENNRAEQEVLDEEKEKLEKKIREEIASLTEEELNNLKEKLEEANSKTKELEEKAKELETKEKELIEELKNKEEEHREALKEYEENSSKLEEPEEKAEPTISTEQIQFAVLNAKADDLTNEIVEKIIDLANLIKNNNLSDKKEITLSQLERTFDVLKNKLSKVV